MPASNDILATLLRTDAREPGYYLLGHGYRAYSPVLMRFISADSLSPFGRGGLNAYAYCLGDPVNLIDPGGHSPLSLFWGRIKRSYRSFTNTNSPRPVLAPSSSFEKNRPVPNGTSTQAVKKIQARNLPEPPAPHLKQHRNPSPEAPQKPLSTARSRDNVPIHPNPEAEAAQRKLTEEWTKKRLVLPSVKQIREGEHFESTRSPLKNNRNGGGDGSNWISERRVLTSSNESLGGA